MNNFKKLVVVLNGKKYRQRKVFFLKQKKHFIGRVLAIPGEGTYKCHCEKQCDLICLEYGYKVYSYCQVAFLKKIHYVLHLSMFREEN